MMRTLLVAVAIASASAGDMACALDGSAAASDAINAGIFAWAATERCGKAGTEVNCAIDILSALQGVNSMINTILSATDSCGGLNTENPECGLAASEFTASVEGFGAAVAGTVSDCTGHTPGQGKLDQATDLGNCVGDLSGSVAGIFGAASAFRQVSAPTKWEKAMKQVSGEDQNAGNALHVMDAIASLGGAIAGSVKDCTIVHTKHEPATVGCVADVLGAFGSLSGIASAATALAAKCPASPARLYEVEHAAKAASASNSSLFTAALPITAMASLVLGFVGGSRFAKRPGMTSVPQQDEEARDVLLMEE